MTDRPTCPECGADLPANAPQGLCPHCLATMALSLVGTSEHSLPDTHSTPHAHQASVTNHRLRYLGDYELLEEIARGGMGVVYRARQVSLNRIVAVKVLLFGEFSSNEFLQRFRTEAEAAASLQHPNIVAIHEVGEHEGQHYFSMDYVEGRNLSEFVRDKPLAAKVAARYLKTISEAIHYAHQHGVLHRDLKPSNVLIDHEDQPRVTDFGLAKRLTMQNECSARNTGSAQAEEPSQGSGSHRPASRVQYLTVTGQVLGSPAYMPPEQAGTTHNGLVPSSDVYSLGALLYNLLTGRPPFAAETLEEMLLQVLNTDPVSPRLLNPSVPRDLETICLKCLEKDPDRRYQTAQALANELARYLRGESILARPLNRVQKGWRWCRREPLVASWVAAAFMLLLLGSSLVLWQWRRAESNAEQNRRLLYVRDLSVAFTQWNEGNLWPVLTVLRNQKPKNGQTDLRGFEWRHLWWLCHQDSVLALPTRNQVAGAMVFSPNGKMLAVYYWDDTVRLWDLDDPRRELLTVTNATALGGFVGNGERYLVGTRGGTIKTYKTKTGDIVSSQAAPGELVAVATNGHRAVILDPDNVIKILDTATGAIIFTKPGKVDRRSDYGWGPLITISPDGKLLAAIKSGKSSRRFDDSIELWNIETQESVPLVQDRFQIRCLAFSGDSGTLAIGNGDGGIEMFNLISKQREHLAGQGLPVLSLAFSTNGKTLAAGGADETVQLWDVATRIPMHLSFRGPMGQVWSLAFSPDGQGLAAGGRNSVLRLRNLSEKAAPDEIEGVAPHEDWGNFTFSQDSKLIAAACKGDAVKVWEVKTFNLIAMRPDASYVVGFSQNSKNLLVSSATGTPVWWNLEANSATSIPGRNTTGARSADLSPDGRLAVLGRDDGMIQLLEIASGRDLAPPWPGHQGSVRSVKFSPRGDKILSGGQDRSIKVWDVVTQRLLGANSPGEHRGAICSLAYSRDGKMLASGCGADMIKLWKESDLTRALASMPYHQAAVRTLDFSGDGKTLASGSDDNTVRLFSVDSNQEITTFSLESPARLVLFSPDGNTLAMVTANGKLKLLRASNLAEADHAAGAFQK